MTIGKRLTFAGLTVLLVLAALEGVARLIWWRLETRAFARLAERGEELLRNDAINFMKVADGHYGYVLRPGFKRAGTVINAQGFAQRDSVAVPRRPGSLRVIALGESTTQGHNVDTANYPVYLKALLRARGQGAGDVEVINAGVAGWVSDQLALRAERELAAYRPDIVVLYTGWNDFQSYDPYGPPPARSFFEVAYRTLPVGDRLGLKSVDLLSSAYTSVLTRLARRAAARSAPAAGGERTAVRDLYRYYVASLDRIVHAFRLHDSGVRIAICTLVGRWPMGTADDFAAPAGRTWWMKVHGLTPGQAAADLDRLNALIREYAAANGLILIDAAAAFAGLDRAALQRDFAHLSAEGYELLGEIIYDGLVHTGAVHGERSPRLDDLRRKYTLASVSTPS